MKLRGWVIPKFVLVAGALLGGWFMQGPARTAHAIQHALETSNTVALTQHIDFPQLRTRVKDRMVRATIAQTPSKVTAIETLAVITGPAFDKPECGWLMFEKRNASHWHNLVLLNYFTAWQDGEHAFPIYWPSTIADPRRAVAVLAVLATQLWKPD